MVKVEYSHRLLCDYSFLNSLKNQPNKHAVFSQMLRIKSSSSNYPKTHSVMLSDDFDKLVSEKYCPPDNLAGLVKSEKLSEVINSTSNTDNFTKNILYAIYLSGDKPYKTAILTSEESKKIYSVRLGEEKIKHSVEVLGGEEALDILNRFDQLYRIKRDDTR
ncbi:hypothetical protein HY993_01330 [Candidatus Micrarchaeota archaeon]|nr:hypothetical protein [Candidatus Micrarchaeota archaeon]